MSEIGRIEIKESNQEFLGSLGLCCEIVLDHEHGAQWKASSDEAPWADAWHDYKPLAVLEHFRLRLDPEEIDRAHADA
jgi:hypothetical protein